MPERILYYDCSAGISGDMHLGAMVDLGVPPEHLESELRKLGVAGWKLTFVRDARKGIGGTRADVLLESEAAPGASATGTTKTTPQSQPFQLHAHGGVEHSHDYEHRRHRDIVALIQASALTEPVKQRSLSIFARLAEAEAKIHGVPVAEVAFHEVGAVDSIVDIVGAAIAIEWFKPDRIFASTIELGSGFVNCAHGRLPVPAPATIELLRGIPVRRFSVPFEATTPTGAAILCANAHGFTDTLDFSIEKIGYGIGHKDGPLPNILRVFLAQSVEKNTTYAGRLAAGREEAVLLECNLDDMTGEEIGHVIERLLATGAADAWATPIVMKKSRPALLLSVLGKPADEAKLCDLVLRETSTFGLRRRLVDKQVLERSFEDFASSLGSIRVKSAWLEGKRVKWKFEYEDLKRLAAEHRLPLRTLENQLRAEYERRAPK
jgi:hypothetical protein